jgi:large subunit ribosomal protein L1
MAKLTKREKKMQEILGTGPQGSGQRVPRPLDEALDLVRQCASAKFDETVEVAVNLGVDPRKSDQVVRGSTVLPNGTGKNVRVAVFASGDAAEAARNAGADLVGKDDLAEAIKGGTMDFDVLIATPDLMSVVSPLGRILGPRGLMPNPKVGTVTADVATAVRNAKGGQVRYRTDKVGIIHCPIGKASFSVESLRGNLDALMADLHKMKPSTSKGIYVKKLTVSTTMGPGVPVDRTSFKAI